MTKPQTLDLSLIDEAVANAHYPSLLMMLVHLRGDPGLLTEERRPVSTDFVSNLSGVAPQVEAEVRTMARHALTALLDGTVTLPSPPNRAQLLAMINFLAGRDIPEEYFGFLEDELAITSPDARKPDWRLDSPSGTVTALVIGAGMSGLLAGLRFKQAGIPFRIIEKNADVGGTWFENIYPGCRVDSNNQIYSYSFEPNPTWPDRFSTQPEILAYFQHVADRFDLRQHIEFNTKVVDARFCADSADWAITVESDAGRREERASILVSAVGQLNTPSIPVFKGREDFRGPAFHSAQWRRDVDLTGKRVAVIGTGASAFQFVPEIIDQVAELRLFQRTPPWLLPTPDYHDSVPQAERWLLEHGPFYASWYRFWQFWMFVDGLHPQVIADPDFAGNPLAISSPNAELREACEEWIRGQVEDRPDLLPLLIPTYPVGGKRALRDNGLWIQTLKRPNLRIVTAAIERFDQAGVVTTDAEHHDVDVVIYATGFSASDFLSSFDLKGRDGRSLHDIWGEDARAYLGITIPNFPNLYCLYGPNTNLVVNGSIIFFAECAAAYMMNAIRWMLDHDVAALDVRQDVYDRYNQEVDDANANMAWGSPHVSSWYKSASGRVSQNWPFRTAEYWLRTNSFDSDDYVAIRPN